MTSISEARTLGGIGSILVLLTAVPNVGWLLGIAGFVMILIAINGISTAVGDRKIFDDMLIAIILVVGAIALGTIAILGAVFHVLDYGTFVGSHFVPPPSLTFGDIVGSVAGLIAGLLAVWVLLVVSAAFVRKAYNLIGAKLNVKMFETAALLYLIGAVTTILAVGFVVIFVAQILLAVSFFSISEQPPIMQANQSQTISAARM